MQQSVGSLASAFSLLLCLLIFPCASVGQDDSSVRTWRSGKFSLEARLFERRGNEVVLVGRDGKKQKPINLEALCEEDQRFLNGLEVIGHDRAQYDAVMQHLKQFNDDPKQVVEELERIAERHKESPYAKMMIGIAFATQDGKYNQAKRHFEAAARIINKQREIIGARYHVQTLASLENNIALCALKMNQGDKAAVHFVAGSQQRVPYVLHHNATILNKIAAGKSRIKFSSKGRANLSKVVSLQPTEPAGIRVPEMYLFLLHWDQPLSDEGLAEIVSAAEDNGLLNLEGGRVNEALVAVEPMGPAATLDSELDLRRRGFREYGLATGILISPALLLCNHHEIDSEAGESTYSLTHFSRAGFPEQVAGRVVMMSAVGGQNLALIKLDQPIEKAKVVSLRTRNLRPDEALALVGFPAGSNRAEDFVGKTGFFAGNHEHHPWIYISKRQGEGSVAGPCLDLNGDLVAMSIQSEKPDNRRFAEMHVNDAVMHIRGGGQLHKCVGVSNEAIFEFVREAVPNFRFEANEPQEFDNPREIADSALESVILIRTWRASRIAAHHREQQEMRLDPRAQLMAMRNKGIHPDIRCMSCAGRGGSSCKGCLGNGKVVVMRREQVGGQITSSFTPLYRDAPQVQTCSQCAGRGVFDCRDCYMGALPFRYPRK